MAESTDSPWLVAICSVLFDLDVGQRIDSIVPEGVLTDEEANDVAFHSFPVWALRSATASDAHPIISCMRAPGW
jgi:hypothetical protein